jgi:acyl transferase domain-containing protein/phosphopantetheinyl transferase (holo-ACP synthase)
MLESVAIVGMAAVFPGAPDLATYWSNLERGFDAITEAPLDRLDPAFASAFECKRGGFVSPVFDPIEFGIMPITAASAEPDQLLALAVAAAAIGDVAGAVPRDRAGVILGRGGYLTPGMARLANRVRTTQQLVTTLGELLPDLDAETVERIRAAFRARVGEAGPEAAIGLVPNLAASRIANRLDLRGPAYTIDAACASSLLAIDQGCRELADRRCDVVVVGGVHVCHDVTFWSVFNELGALSRTSSIRPFDRRADGIVIGEGAGIVVLKRLTDAERDGDRIYAVIAGTGVTSDGRESSAMRPRADGQLAAIEAAWRDRDPATIGLLEAHGTATPTGDEVELTALAQFFGTTTGARAALGSVKSMIGHAMPAAGAAGMIKTALALYHGVVPPSLHCDEPHAALARTRFRVPAAAEPWGELARRAGVSAFGFGGINAHIVLEAHATSSRKRRGTSGASGLLAVAGDSIDELHAALDGGPAAPRGAMRLAMLDPTPERRALAHQVLERGRAWRGNKDIWFAPRGLSADGGKLAFVFPGVEATFALDLSDLGDAPPHIAAALTDQSLEARGRAVFALGRALMARIPVQPDVIAGHSLGEWTAMVASEMIPSSAIDAFLDELPPSLEVPDVVFAAVGCSAAGASAALDGLDHIAVSHDNCPHQSILCGRRDRVQVAVERLGRRGVLCQELPFRSGFHSPLFADYLAPHRARLATLALQRPRVPLWSATTCAPYPDDPAAIRRLAIDHLVEPVRFRELVENLHAAGVRAFVQLGTGNTTGFVDDTLRGKDHLAVAAASPQPGQLARARAALWVEGFIDEIAGTRPRRAGMALELGVPLVRIGKTVGPLALGEPRAATAGDDPVLAELLATLDDAAAASRAVVEAYRAKARPSHAVVRRTLSVEHEPALIDHCFYRQPAGWANVSDRYPVVPMTMNVAMMIDAARRLAPDKVAIALEDVRAYRWLAVAPAVDVEITARASGDRVDVEIPGYARATVVLADRYPPAPAPVLAPLVRPRAAPFSARTMYDERWMFHGPQYQGVSELGRVGDNGIDGAIDVLPAPGALLDCAGQLMGWWVMHTETHDRLAMPVRIERIALFGPEPVAGRRVACRVRMRHVREREACADLELIDDGRVWAKIDAWEDRRFDSDDAVWAVLMYPERNALAERCDGGYVRVTEHWRAAASRELMMRRYLGEPERRTHDELGPRGRRGWLLGRIAIKDAVRMQRWQAGDGAIFPVEIEVRNEPSGRPVVTGGPHVSVAHKGDLAVAIVGDREVGIDVERVEPRTDAFAQISYTAGELALGDGSDEWHTRLWAAKEAAAKARGTGITDPKRFEVTRREGERLYLGELAVDTRREGEYIIAWTRT